MIAFLKGLPLAAKISIPVILALLVALAVARADAAKWRRNATREGFRADSAAAAADTTRRIVVDRDRELARALAGLDLYERRVVQLERLPSDLATALGTQASAIASMQASIVALSARVTSTNPVVETPAGDRSASFTVDQAPYTGTVGVVLPPPPASGRMDLNIRLAPAPLTLTLSCRDGAGPAGIREALANVTTPPWLEVDIRRVEQSAAVCNASAVDRARGARWRLGVGAFLGICAAAPVRGLKSPAWEQTTGAVCLGGGLTLERRK